MAGPHELTPAGNIKSPIRQNIIDWVSKAWESVTAGTIQTAFLRAGISNAIGGSQEDLVGVDIPPVPVVPGELNQLLFNDDDDDLLGDGVLHIGDMEP